MKKDIEQFESIFKKLQPRLFAYCCKYVEDKEIARDIVQDSFISLWENYADIKTSIEHYLIITVRNRSVSHFRSQKLHANYTESLYLKIKEAEFNHEHHDPLTDLYMSEVDGLIRQTIENLPEKCKQVFQMSRYEGMKNHEIAETLDISIRTVEAQIYQALKVLKNKLKDYLSVFIFFI